MAKKLLTCGTVGLWLAFSMQSSAAATIGVGPYTPSATASFVVPVEITGAVNLDSFTFDLSFDPNDYMIDTACDPFAGDPYCGFTGPVTQGTFYDTPFQLFDPGFIPLDASQQQTGQLIGVNGAWEDIGPSPSGDGILAFVEFVAVAGGSLDSPITVDGMPTSITVPEPTTLALLVAAFVGCRVEGRARRRRGDERRSEGVSCA
jgi:hypothetical protein